MALLLGPRLTIRSFHATACLNKIKAGRYRKSPKGNLELTYEMANPPHFIGVRKGWNSWNTSNLSFGFKPPGNIWNMADMRESKIDTDNFEQHTIDTHRGAETMFEDVFIRKFMIGTWHSLIVSEVIIKRQHNIIRLAAIIRQGISARKMYFLLGYTEEMLTLWLQCPVFLEIQTTPSKKDVVFKYV